MILFLKKGGGFFDLPTERPHDFESSDSTVLMSLGTGWHDTHRQPPRANIFSIDKRAHATNDRHTNKTFI